MAGRVWWRAVIVCEAGGAGYWQGSVAAADIALFRYSYDTSFAAPYTPWLTVKDSKSGKTRSPPPSGHLAGLYARVDAERGVWKAPANEVIAGADGSD